MNPTQEQIQNRLDAVKNTGVNQDTVNTNAASVGVPVISIDTLKTPQNPLRVPPAPEPTLSSAPNFENLISQATAVNPLEVEQAKQQAQFSALLGEGGRADFRAQQEQALGVTDKRAETARLAGRLQTLQAESDTLEQRLQASIRGRGVTEGGLAPIRSAQQRDLDVRKRFAAADLLAAQGDLAAALGQIQTAVEDRYADRQDKLNAQKSNLDYLQQQIEQGNVRSTNALNLKIAERNRVLAAEEAALKEEKATQMDISKLALTARQYGADDATVRAITDAKTFNEAINIAGSSLRDPVVQQQLLSMKLDQQLKSLKIQQAQAELKVFQENGGLTPAEYNKKLEDEAKARKEADASITQAENDAIEAQQGITQIDAILNSDGLDAVVGPNAFARGIGRQKGLISTTAKTLASVATGLTTSGIAPEITGSADDTVALTQQILDQQFLDKLIAVKSKGATFGALSDNEGQALRNAANAIAGTAIKSGNLEKGTQRVIGYDMSEKAFKEQMTIIQNSIRKVYERASGEAFTPEEQAILDSLDATRDAIDFNPAF